MPLSPHNANLVLSKEILEAKYPGGVEGFKNDHPPYPAVDEDQYLLLYPQMNYDDLDLDQLIKHLHWDEEQKRSDDFVIFLVYGENPWSVDWAHFNSVFIWHEKERPAIKERLQKVGELTVDKLFGLVDQYDRDLIDIVLDEEVELNF